MKFELGNMVKVGFNSDFDGMYGIIRAIDTSDPDQTYGIEVINCNWEGHFSSEHDWLFDLGSEWGESIDDGTILVDERYLKCHTWDNGNNLEIVKIKATKLSRHMYKDMIELDGWLYPKDYE